MSRMRASLAVAVAIAAVALVRPHVAHADGTAVSADADAKEKSRAAFRRGVAQLRAKEWSAARASFEQAYALFPHPSILLNLGISRLRTNDPVLAEADLTKFLSEDAGSSSDEIAGAREALAEAKSKVGTLRVIATPPSARVTIDGKRVENVKREGDSIVAEVRAKPGKHAVVVEAESYGTQNREVEIQAKNEIETKVALASTEKKDVAVVGPTSQEPDRTTRNVVGWSLVGLGGAAVIAGGVFGFVAKSKADDYNDPGASGFQDPSLKSSGTTFRTMADVSFGVAIVSGVIGIVLLATDVGMSKNAALSHPALLRW